MILAAYVLLFLYLLYHVKTVPGHLYEQLMSPYKNFSKHHLHSLPLLVLKNMYHIYTIPIGIIYMFDVLIFNPSAICCIFNEAWQYLNDIRFYFCQTSP